MKTIGLIGGMSWESTLDYYKIINEQTKRILGGSNSAKILIDSLNYYELETLFSSNDWEKIAQIIIHSAKGLEQIGADCILICANTTHIIAKEVEEAINIPLIHIVDSVEKAINHLGIKKVALLGTKYTIESNLYSNRFSNDITVLKPNQKQKTYIHQAIYNELILGEFREESRDEFKRIIKDLKNKGAEGVILGCTEIPLLIKQEDVDIPIFHTTKIHALAAVDFSLKQ
ncbi:MAG: aspartate/glutamate racemase family protein [Candidatus Izimaplasma sp.]|nr:aspartate/glutamate racemase family protein [Candidatus Izimaplasma bacterium]